MEKPVIILSDVADTSWLHVGDFDVVNRPMGMQANGTPVGYMYGNDFVKHSPICGHFVAPFFEVFVEFSKEEKNLEDKIKNKLIKKVKKLTKTLSKKGAKSICIGIRGTRKTVDMKNGKTGSWIDMSMAGLK